LGAHEIVDGELATSGPVFDPARDRIKHRH
jgi:hypothetical protein